MFNLKSFGKSQMLKATKPTTFYVPKIKVSVYRPRDTSISINSGWRHWRIDWANLKTFNFLKENSMVLANKQAIKVLLPIIAMSNVCHFSLFTTDES